MSLHTKRNWRNTEMCLMFFFYKIVMKFQKNSVYLKQMFFFFFTFHF